MVVPRPLTMTCNRSFGNEEALEQRLAAHMQPEFQEHLKFAAQNIVGCLAVVAFESHLAALVLVNHP
jgi:hypothetical protein